MSHEENDRGLGQLRRLKREQSEFDPAVRVVGAVEEKHRGQKQRRDAQGGEDQRGPVEFAVVQPHAAEHGGQADEGVDALLHQECGLGAEFFLGDDGRGAEDHDQSGEDHQQRHAKQPPIHADPLRH